MRTQGPGPSLSDFRYSPLVAALALAFGSEGASAGPPQVVNVPGDRPVESATIPGTLRAAIEFFNVPANCTGTGDAITFFSNGPFVVNVSDALPIITCGDLTINGDLGSGNRAQLIQGVSAIMDGIVALTPTPISVSNLQVSSFTYGTALLGNINSDNNMLTGNTTGYDSQDYSGLTVANNVMSSNRTGINLGGNIGNQINNVQVVSNQIFSNSTGIFVAYGGSTVVIDTNTITGNVVPVTQVGVGIGLNKSFLAINNNQISANDTAIYVESDHGSKITNNRVGTTNDGLEPMGNSFGIVFGTFVDGVSYNTEISGNVISGNGDFAIDLSEFVGTKILGNKIGTTIDGNSALSNNGGIIAYCGTGIQVGGNVISANSGNAIEFGAVQGGGALNIVDNKIGVSGNGVTALGNNAYGVALYFGNCDSATFSYGGTNNLLIRGNTIANNTDDGVLVSNGVGDKIVENLIYANGGKNINLSAPGGPRPNDGGDADTGPNNGQNYPDIQSAVRDWPNARTAVNFLLDTVPGSYRIDVYSNGTTGDPGGKIWHGAARFDAGAGPTPGTIMVNGLSVGNEPNNFSLTATAPWDNNDINSDSIRGDTSEFSPTKFIVPTPDVTITPNPAALDFGQVSIDSVSPPQSFTLRSSGNEPYQISRMRLDNCSGALIYGGPFMISSTCGRGVLYAPGQACQITAMFAPIVTGPANATIAICDNTNFDGTRLFTMTGVGGIPPPVTFNPAEFDFGSVLAGSKSPPQEFAISNQGTGLVSIGPVTVSSGDFVIDSSTCGTSIASGAICVAMVRFAPSQPQRSDATLSVSAAIADSLIVSGPAAKGRKVAGSGSAHLTGLGLQVADIQLPASIDFGAYTLNTPPIRQTVDIVNAGNAVVTFNSISVTGPFVLTNGCTLNLAPGERCTITLDFSSTTLGEFSGTLAVVSNATGGTRTIPLTAHSIPVAAPQLSVSPLTMSFGDRLLGTTSATQRVTIRNIGNAPALIGSVTASPDFLVVGNTCTLPLAPTSTCFADVALRPVGFGPRTGSLFVNSNAADSPNVVGLGGTGCRPFSSSASRFGSGTGFNCAP